METRADRDESFWGQVAFLVAAAVVGSLTGVVAAVFKLLLVAVAGARNELVAWGHGTAWLGLPVVVAACALAAGVAGWLVRRVEPHAEGSGIPRVEAVVQGRTGFGSRRILPVKFVGSLLAIGSGLALGREGPLVQMGGNAGITVGRAFRRGPADVRILVAAGAGAGLATAFNAPIAGAVFVLEELLKRFEHRTVGATLVASASGFAAARLVAPDAPEFRMAPLAAPHLAQAPWVAVVGVVCALVGVGYNRLVLFCLALADRSRVPTEYRAAILGGGVGLLGWCWPAVVGGGDNLTEAALAGSGTLGVVCLVLVVRLALGPLSYAGGTPGGLFAPMLVLGTHLGLVVGLLAGRLTPGLGVDAPALALIGMAAFFTATVRAPVTGIVLATEMTQTTAVLPPMLGACALAMFVAQVLRSEPIYEALAKRSAAAARTSRGASSAL